MNAIEHSDINFVRALLKAGSAERNEEGAFSVKLGTIRHHLSASASAHLASEGVIICTGVNLIPTDITRSWLKRQLSMGQDAYASQHRVESTDKAGRHINLNESPLARLASRNYLRPHHILAGERFRKLIERAGLRPRIVMSYNPDPVSQKRGRAAGSADISDMAVDARAALQRIYAALPADCTGILFDVCGYEKGLQQVETERVGRVAVQNWSYGSALNSWCSILDLPSAQPVGRGDVSRHGWPLTHDPMFMAEVRPWPQPHCECG